MPISFVGAGTAAAGNNSGLTPALPSGLQSGDLMLIVFSARGAGTIGTPTGWTERWTITHTSSGINRVKLLYRFFQTGDTAPTVTYTGGANGHTTLAQCFAFRGVSQATPFDTSGSASSNASAQNIGPISGITPQTNGACVLVIGHKADDCTSIATLTGDGLTWARAVFGTSTSGNDASQVADYAIISGSPVTITSKTFTVTGGAANTGLGIMDSLRAAPETRTASLSLSDQADSISASGAVELTAAASLTDQADIASAQAQAAVAATAVAQDEADQLSASASSQQAEASLSLTDQADAVSAQAAVGISAVCAVQDASDSIVSAAAAPVGCTLSLADASDSIAAAASAVAAAGVVVQDAEDAAAGVAAVALSAALELQDQTDTLLAEAAGQSSAIADLSASDAADLLACSAALHIAAALAAQDVNDGLAAEAAAIAAAAVQLHDIADWIIAEAGASASVDYSMRVVFKAPPRSDVNRTQPVDNQISAARTSEQFYVRREPRVYRAKRS